MGTRDIAPPSSSPISYYSRHHLEELHRRDITPLIPRQRQGTARSLGSFAGSSNGRSPGSTRFADPDPLRPPCRNPRGLPRSRLQPRVLERAHEVIVLGALSLRVPFLAFLVSIPHDGRDRRDRFVSGSCCGLNAPVAIAEFEPNPGICASRIGRICRSSEIQLRPPTREPTMGSAHRNTSEC
jgi:hypothetical protein